MIVLVMHCETESTPDDPEFVAVHERETDEQDDMVALQTAFRETQSVDIAWNREAPWQRSTDVGDVISCDERLYMVISVAVSEPFVFEMPIATFEQIFDDS